MTTLEKQITKEIEDNAELREQLKKLVLARTQAMPNSLGIVIGSDKITREEMVQHVQQEDEIGKQIMELQLEFLRDLATGAIYTNE